MHLPDHTLDPAVAWTAAAIAAGGVAWAFRAAHAAPRAKLPLLGALAAAIFAAQSLNFPVLSGHSGHFLGGALAGILLGPPLGILAMTCVVSVQALLFADGGISALGANLVNLALIGPLVGSALFHAAAPALAKLRLPAASSNGFSAGLAGGLAVLLAAALCGLELALSASALDSRLPAILLAHLPVAIAEAFITGAAVLLVGQSAVTPAPAAPAVQNLSHWLVAAAASMAILLSPWASSLPDGLEAVLGDQPMAASSLWQAPLAGIQLNGLEISWLATGVATLLGAVGAGLAGLACENGLAFARTAKVPVRRTDQS